MEVAQGREQHPRVNDTQQGGHLASFHRSASTNAPRTRSIKCRHLVKLSQDQRQAASTDVRLSNSKTQAKTPPTGYITMTTSTIASNITNLFRTYGLMDPSAPTSSRSSVSEVPSEPKSLGWICHNCVYILALEDAKSTPSSSKCHSCDHARCGQCEVIYDKMGEGSKMTFWDGVDH